MGVLEDVLKGNGLTTVAIGAAALVLAPVVVSVVAGAFRPLAKAAIKSGLIIYDRGREAFAGVAEVAEDIVAEARAEMAQGRGATLATAIGGGVGEVAAKAREAGGWRRSEAAAEPQPEQAATEETERGGRRTKKPGE